MKNGKRMQIVLAAVIIVLLGVVFGFAETKKVEVKVKQGEGRTVSVEENGSVDVVKLKDLADGEERQIQAGDRTLTVRRDGNQLTVQTEGDEDVSSDPGVTMKARKIVLLTNGAEDGDGKLINLRCVAKDNGELDGDAIDIETMIDGDLGDGNGTEIPIMIKNLKTVVEDSVHLRCPEDGTTVIIPKEKATQERYMCPVCGREMKKEEMREMKITTAVATPEKEGGSNE